MLLQPISRKVVDMRGDYMRELTEKRLAASEKLKESKALEKEMQRMMNNSSDY